jgi:hypothetical protein
MTTATVSIPYSEFQAIKEAREKAEQEVATIKRQITEEMIEASNQETRIVARAALEVARFAVANLPPEVTIGWPTEALRAIAKSLPSMPDATLDDPELAITLDHFAMECERFEARRRVFGTVVAAPETREASQSIVAHTDQES